MATVEHDLSTPSGPPALTWASLSYDAAQDEVFVTAEGFVRIFDRTGMEVHRFGDDGALGTITRVVALEDGELIVLSLTDGKRVLHRCDFRGEPIVRFPLTGLPETLADFQPDQMVYRAGRIYLAERGTMRVVVVDTNGAFHKWINLRAVVANALPRDGERKPPSHMDGFGVDVHGNLLFTASTMFSGGVVSPSGEVRFFGARGSRPGRFNVIGGIDADEHGYIFVTDRLRSVVSVWDPMLRHLGDFGYRGGERDNLIAPYEIAAGKGKVFVSQGADRGVKVFRIQLVDAPKLPDPPPPPHRLPPPPRPPPPSAPQASRQRVG